MADPKGIYFGGGNTGLATVLPDSNPAAFALQQQQQQAVLNQRRQAAIDKRKAAMMKQLSDLNSADSMWMDDFQTNQVSPLIDKLSKLNEQGRFDEAEILLAKETNRLNNFADASKQAAGLIAAERESIFQNNLLTQEGKEDLFRSSVLETVTDKEGNIVSPDQVQGFEQDLFAEGASARYNTGAVIQGALDNADFKQQTVAIQDTDDRIKNVGNGFVRIGGQKIQTSSLPYVNIDNEGNVGIKPPAELISSGVLDGLMNDPYMARVIDDEVMKRNPNVLSQDMDMNRAEVLGDILQGYKGGTKFEKIDTSQIRAQRKTTINIDKKGEEKITAQKAQDKWLNNLQSGDEELMNLAGRYLMKQEWVDGRQIVGVNQMSGSIIELKLRDNKGSTTQIGSKPGGIRGEKEPVLRNVKGGEDHIFLDISNVSNRELLLNLYNNAFKANKRHYAGKELALDLDGLMGASKFSHSTKED